MWKYRKISLEEFKKLKENDEVYVGFNGFMERCYIIDKPFYNKDADEPCWEIDTDKCYASETDTYLLDYDNIDDEDYNFTVKINGEYYMDCCYPILENGYLDKTLIQAIQKLGEYEELKRQGSILCLMCKKDDIIFHLDKETKEIIRLKVVKVEVFGNDFLYHAKPYDKNGKGLIFDNKNFGHVVFKTSEEAFETQNKLK